MRLSVVVLAHNQSQMTRRCLQALAAALDGTDHEVLCVDNASTEDLGPLRDEGTAFRRFALTRNNENLSFSSANNHAASSAAGDWLLFLNNDVEVGPSSIRALAEFVERHPEARVCGGRLIYPGGQRLQHAGIEQMLWGLVSNYGVGASTSDDRFRHDTERFAVTGAMLCIRRDVFERVGGFDESYAWGYEDVDLCLRARAAGLRVHYVAAAEGVHCESTTLRTKRRSADVDENYRVYRRKWDHILKPAESRYLGWMESSGIRRVVVFGTGSAGKALCETLDRAGVTVAGFTATAPDVAELRGRPVVPLAEVARLSHDRLVVGTQLYFEIEGLIRAADPAREPLFPVLRSDSGRGA